MEANSRTVSRRCFPLMASGTPQLGAAAQPLGHAPVLCGYRWPLRLEARVTLHAISAGADHHSAAPVSALSEIC
eukprot:6488712-Amphidinium_carterae.1